MSILRLPSHADFFSAFSPPAFPAVFFAAGFFGPILFVALASHP
jgi:hypothetical protein